jgi:hypothetical protein
MIRRRPSPLSKSHDVAAFGALRIRTDIEINGTDKPRAYRLNGEKPVSLDLATAMVWPSLPDNCVEAAAARPWRKRRSLGRRSANSWKAQFDG